MRIRVGAASLFSALLVAVVVAAPACGSSEQSSFADAGDDATIDGSAPPVCAGGTTACGAACVDTATDVKNCGGCGTSCAAGGTCCAGACLTATASCSFSVVSAQPAQGPITGGAYVTLKGSGFVAGMRVEIGDGVAPVRVIDAQTAIVQTPPGPLGEKPITIRSGALTSTLPHGYVYAKGSVQLPWQEKPMGNVRGEDPGLAVMQDGRVLIVGGTTVPDDGTKALPTAEIFTRKTDSVLPAKNAMAVPRWHSSAVTMLNGKVLVVGDVNGASKVADIFDPATDTFSQSKSQLSVGRKYTRSVLMTDGRVMISSADEQTADIYDPDKDSFTQIPLNALHTFGFMVRLRDGRVMLGGGQIPSGNDTTGQKVVEIYDPATGKFDVKGALNQGRTMLTAHTLPDGRVMVIGGASESAGAVRTPLDSVELYDPATDKWTVAPYKLAGGPAPNTGRTWHASALVFDGTVLVMGGYNTNVSCTPNNTVDQIDPVKNTIAPFGTLPHPNTEWTAVTFLDGSVLGVGGGACGTPTALPSLDFLLGGPAPH